MQALSSIGTTLAGEGGGWTQGLTNTLNMASGLAQSFAPMFMGQGFNPMSMMMGMPLFMRGLQGMNPAIPYKPSQQGNDWGSILPDLTNPNQGLSTYQPFSGANQNYNFGNPWGQGN